MLSGPRLAQEDLVFIFCVWADMQKSEVLGREEGGGGVMCTNHSSSESLKSTDEATAKRCQVQSFYIFTVGLVKVTVPLCLNL